VITFLLREGCPSANVCVPLIPRASLSISRPPNRLGVSARDSLRLTRRGQVKSMAGHVPTFTQHTQLFHRRQNWRSERKPSRNSMHSLRKNQMHSHRPGRFGQKNLKTSLRALWKKGQFVKFIFAGVFFSCSLAIFGASNYRYA